MSLLKTERATLHRFLPDLDERLAAIPFADRERPGSPVLSLFREARGPALVIPPELGGLGATPLDAVRVHRALGSRAPSLALGATMHNFSVATLVEFSIFGGDESCATLLSTVAEERLLMASGFAEGRSGTHILAATMEARSTPDGGYSIRGSKKPCTLSRSMDLLSASAVLIDGERRRRAVVLVPADAPGIERRPFWGSPVLTGAESDELILEDVVIPGDLLFFPETEEQLDPVEIAGYLWFQLLVSASYLGVASALVERVLLEGRAGPVERTQLGIEVQGAMAALESLARAMGAGESRAELLPQALLVRYAVQASIERSIMTAAEYLGGISFVSAPDVAYLIAASRALAFHPPSRLSSASALAEYLAGRPLASG